MPDEFTLKTLIEDPYLVLILSFLRRKLLERPTLDNYYTFPLTHFIAKISFDYCWKHRKPEVFWYFQGVSKEISGMKWFESKSTLRKLCIKLCFCYKRRNKMMQVYQRQLFVLFTSIFSQLFENDEIITSFCIGYFR